MKIIVAGMIAVATLAGAGTGAQAQSFNCRKAYFPDEKLICTSPELSNLDERLDGIFRQNLRLLSKAGRDALDREEERWVVARRRCGRDYRCVEGFYRSRIGELSERLGEARDDTGGGDRAERRGRPSAADERGRSDRSERATRREAAAPPSLGDETSQGGETPAHRVPPPPASEKRQSAPARPGADAPRGTAAAVAKPAPSRRPASPESPNTVAPGPASGNTISPPRIEFADPAPGPMTPSR
jgi:uncharacterized protein YecT (DUF1311 family)